MTLAFGFATPLLLLGLLAAGIPFILHLLSSVKAQEVFFPTLRFLRRSMEKTARRRRIQQWLLLLIRAGLLAFLVFAVAEPISRAAGGFLAGKRYASVLILDNSLSMAAQNGPTNRFALARDEARALLSREDPPALAALLTTNGGMVSSQLTSELAPLREGINKARIGAGRAAILPQIQTAIGLLQKESVPQKAIYVFSDLQRISFEEVLSSRAMANAKDIHLLIVNTARSEVNNVGISELDITGQRIVDSVLEFTATLVNSSAGEKVVDVGLRVGGQNVGQKIRKGLQAAGYEGSRATVRFRHRFSQPGPVTGEAYLEQSDDLLQDNVRRFSLTIGGRVKVLVVRGQAGATDSPSLDPASMLLMALDPYAGESAPWSIKATSVEADKFASTSLADMDGVFFCEVASFTSDQAKTIADFVQEGGTVAFFLGPNVLAENYNERFVQEIKAEGGLLPCRLNEPVGEVGPDADAQSVDWVDTTHPYFEGLYENRADYLTILVQRYFRLAPSATPGKTLIRLANKDPLLLVKQFGKGRVVLCATTASPRWANFPITGLFLPAVNRVSLLARQSLVSDSTFLAGAQVIIRPGRIPPGPDGKEPEKVFVNVTPPSDANELSETLPVGVQKTPEGYLASFDQTLRLGVYRWKVSAAGAGDDVPSGQFVVNPQGLESNLQSFDNDTFRGAMARGGTERVYVGSTLNEVNDAASLHAQGQNYWDLFATITIFLLVVEALVANRLRARGDEAIPAHLNPRLAA